MMWVWSVVISELQWKWDNIYFSGHFCLSVAELQSLNLVGSNNSVFNTLFFSQDSMTWLGSSVLWSVTVGCWEGSEYLHSCAWQLGLVATWNGSSDGMRVLDHSSCGPVSVATGFFFFSVWRLGPMEDLLERTGPSVQSCIMPLLHHSCECPVGQSWSWDQARCGQRCTKVWILGYGSLI